MSNPKVIWKTLALKPGGNLLKASTLLISFKSCLTLFKLGIADFTVQKNIHSFFANYKKYVATLNVGKKV
jgi:hypothetical protein